MPMSWNHKQLTMLRLIILPLLLIAVLVKGSTQTEGGIKSETLNEMTDQLDYSKTRKAIVLRKTNKNEWEQREETDDRPGNYNNYTLLQILAFLLIAGLVLLIIYTVFAKINIEKEVPVDEEVQTDLADLKMMDPGGGYQEALKLGDYRLAIRMHFLKVLQSLNEENRIIWKPDKTNRHYLAEMYGSPGYDFFRQLIHIYEWVWYGNTVLNQEKFEQLDPLFHQFINQVDE